VRTTGGCSAWANRAAVVIATDEDDAADTTERWLGEASSAGLVLLPLAELGVDATAPGGIAETRRTEREGERERGRKRMDSCVGIVGNKNNQ
jgi:hypothetical protein